MHIVFRHLEEWYKKDSDLKSKFEATYSTILHAAHDYNQAVDAKTFNKTGKNVRFQISESLLKQALIDAFDDIMRLKDYHLTTDPNRLKEMSYIVFWFLRHKPLSLVDESILQCDELNDIAKARLLYVNESFCIKLLLLATFPGNKPRTSCVTCFEEGSSQLKYFKKFLLYYLVYRVDSPKSIEAILMGTTIFPVWETDPTIWSPPRNPEDEF